MLRARFEDARFFYEDDLAKPLAEFRPLLQGTVFHKDLGTLLDKSVRVTISVDVGVHADVRAGPYVASGCFQVHGGVTEQIKSTGAGA